jgi:hypothetical protein
MLMSHRYHGAAAVLMLAIVSEAAASELPKLDSSWAQSLLDRPEVNLGPVPAGLDCLEVASITNRHQGEFRNSGAK